MISFEGSHTFYFDSQHVLNETDKASLSKKIIEIISAIALGIFYLISAWFSPFFFTMGLFVGAVYSEEVKKRVTNVFKNISWKWIIPTAALLYAFSWPATVTLQGFLSGLDLGARWSKAAQGVNYGKS